MRLQSDARPRVAPLMVAAFAIAATGCQTTVTTSDGTPPAPKPTAGPTTPETARPNAIAVTFGPKPSDTDGNLLPDTLQVTAYLFARPHPAPLFAEGRFHFAIYRLGESGTPESPGAAPLRTWVFDAAAVRAARSRALVGPCHEFQLSLLASRGTDSLPVESVDLVAWFAPDDGGDLVWLRGVRSVQFPRPLR